MLILMFERIPAKIWYQVKKGGAGMIGRNWICAAILSLLIFQTSAWADIYSWTDADGIRRYSNREPSIEAAVLRQTEIPYNQAIDETRRADEASSWRDRKIELEKEQQTALEKEKSETLAEELKETRKELELLESKTEKALEAAQKAAAAEEKNDDWRRIYPYYPHPKHYRNIGPHSNLPSHPELGPNSAVRSRYDSGRKPGPDSVFGPRYDSRRKLGPNSAVIPRNEFHRKHRPNAAVRPAMNSHRPHDWFKGPDRTETQEETGYRLVP